MADDAQPDDDRIRFSPDGIKKIGVRQALIRFAAGALASLLAALVSAFFGSKTAGPLLALPAILIASLTLIAGEDGLRAAIEDSRGAVLGGIGLVAFAVVVWQGFGHLATWLVLVLATVAWAVVSLLLYGIQRLVRERGRERVGSR